MDDALRAGVAVFNAGHHHAAHDAWERRWLAIKADPERRDDERLLHGLIQYAAAVHHDERGNVAGRDGLAESAAGYLAALPADYRGVNVGAVRDYLSALAAEPDAVADRAPPALTVDGAALSPTDLDVPAALSAAPALAEAGDGYDEGVLEAAVAAARETIDAGESGRFLAMVVDFVTEPDRRALVYDRLTRHVARREREREDVAGLFEE